MHPKHPASYKLHAHCSGFIPLDQTPEPPGSALRIFNVPLPASLHRRTAAETRGCAEERADKGEYSPGAQVVTPRKAKDSPKRLCRLTRASGPSCPRQGNRDGAPQLPSVVQDTSRNP